MSQDQPGPSTKRRSNKTKQLNYSGFDDGDASDDEKILSILNTNEDNVSTNSVTDNNIVNAEDGSLMNIQQIPVFNTNQKPTVKSKYESLDYEVCENELWQKEQKLVRPKFTVRKDFARWIIFLLIGVCTALVACIIDIVIEAASFVKFTILKESVDHNIIHGDLVIPYVYWVLCNVGFVFIGSMMVTYIEPVAAGSGIPQVKCYLNGVKVPRVVRIKTLVVKAVGVITSVVGGLAGGKEGPMIHSGAVIAAGISQGKSTTFRRDFKIFSYFRDDHEKRDFVVGGAAAGVSAAFGAPIGGVLFSLEEAASFWNQGLIWRTFFGSIISSFTLNLVLSAYHGMESFTYPGLFNLGEFEPLPFEYFELPIYIVMGAFGGLFGALWNSVNTKMNIFRTRYIKQKWARVVEAVLVAALSATLACVMIYSINDCRPLGNDPTLTPVQLFCEDNEYNAAAALWFQTPESTVKALFHDPPGSHQIRTLIVFVAIYYPLSCLTFGLNVSLGIFIPTLLVGAAWGRLTASFMVLAFPHATFINPGKYALIGAAAQLGGVLRMTLSLSVILIETTGNITFAFPLIITLIAAKFIGDYFNEGIYDTQIKVNNVPMLSWYVPNEYQHLQALDVMNAPVVCVKMREKTKYILAILHKYTHNAFPVVDEVDDNGNRENGRVRGLILRSQLIVILKKSLYANTEKFWIDTTTIETFRNEYPRYPKIEDVQLHEDKYFNNYEIDMGLFMNPSPYTALEKTSVPRVFQIFRALGLRHLIVVDLNSRVRGIITRKDFIKN